LLSRTYKSPARQYILVIAALLLSVSLQPVRYAAGLAQTGTGEKTLLSLLALRLPSSEVPHSYVLFDESASTNAALAYAEPQAAREATLIALQSTGRVSGIQQTFISQTASDNTIVRVLVSYFRSAAAARDATEAVVQPADTSVLSSVPPTGLGDRAHAFRAATDEADGTPNEYVVAWSTGAVQLAVTAEGESANFDLAFDFSLAAQAHAVRVGPPVLSDVDLLARDEQQQLRLAAALDADRINTSVLPPPFARAGSYLWSNEQLVVDARQPDEVAGLIASKWGRLGAVAQYFTAADSSRAVVTTALIAHADSTGASAAVGDVSLAPRARQAVLPLDPPATLGDQTTFFKAVVLWPRAEVRDSYVLQWRRGSVELSVTVNLPPGLPFPDYALNAATALDQSYSAAPVNNSR
jgi:hypothetical protein